MTNDTPRAPQRPHEWTRPTGTVRDPFAWLIEKDDAETVRYLEAENAYAEKWFASHATETETIFQEIKSRIKEDDVAYPVCHRNWWYTSRTETGRSYAIHTRGKTPQSATEFLLLDENIEAADHEYFSLSAFEVSHDSRFVSWSYDIDGSEHFTLRIRDIETGLDLPDVITKTSLGGVAWSRDDQWLFYVMPDDSMRPWQVWRHRIGTPSTDDVLVLEEPDERFFVGLGSTRSGEWIVIEAGSKTSSEAWVIDASQPLQQPRSVSPRRENVEYQIDHWGEVFAMTTNDNALDFRVMIAPTSSPSEWTEFITHEPSQRISQFECFHDFAVMQRWVNAQQEISIVSRDGKVTPISIMNEPHEVEIDSNPDYNVSTIRLSYQSLTTPMVTAQFQVDTSTLTTLKQTEAPNCDLSQYIAERVWAPSHDGVRVPLDIVRHRDTALDGSAPALLYAYGSYEISVAPWFSAGRLSLLDRGWIWALAHPRGGGEMGRQWYLDGKFLNKRNTFLDTIACADHLASQKICDGKKIVVRGGSAGGLLVGACITMKPERFAGAIAEVPFVDVVSTMSDPTLPLTVTEWEEWGDPRVEPFATYMESYSPYDNTTSVRYPDLYVTAGLHDPRVSYHEPAKWVAKIRDVSPTTHVVFKCEMGSGHGGPSGRYEQWRDEARTLTFALASVL